MTTQPIIHIDMTLRDDAPPALGKLVCALALAGLAGCGSLNSVLEPNRIDYRSARKAPSLEVPPDLTQLQPDKRFAIPEAGTGTATATAYAQQQGARPAAATASTPVAPREMGEMRIERAGNQRWLVVKQPPEVLWPKIKDFWQEAGFTIISESPETGVMETDWAENRAKIPQDFIRRALGRVLDSVYSTGERDKFRTRLERGPNGTEIYISHRGAEEVLLGREGDRVVWRPREADPELEAAFLARLMARLNDSNADVKQAPVVEPAVTQPPRAKLVKGAEGVYLHVDEGFERAWRRVGLALDRVGFTVEDRNRAQGTYFVRYLDREEDAQQGGKKGFLSRLFSGSGNDKARQAARYRVAVEGAGETSRVLVLNEQGQREGSQVAAKILSLLNEQLK